MLTFLVPIFGGSLLLVLVGCAAYAIGHHRGSSDAFLRGMRFERAEQANRWPAEPPPEIMYSEGGPHLPNDCGRCARYVLSSKERG